MKRLEYSPNACEKLKQIKRYVIQNFGNETANKVIKEITKSIRDLQWFEEKGISVETALGIPCNYRMLYVRHNYVFYLIDVYTIKIIDIYNEREDFMRKLFGIETTTESTENH